MPAHDELGTEVEPFLDPLFQEPCCVPHCPTVADMATAQPSPSPNPNALRFQLDVSLPEPLSANSAAEASGNPFLEAVFAAPGVAAVFGVNDFVTVTREPGAEWEPIVAVVQAEAAKHL